MSARSVDSSGVEREAVSPSPVSCAAAAAAGNTSGTATALAAEITAVSGADGTAGVRIPSNAKGKRFVVINTDAAQTLKIYPPTGGTINYAGADSALSVTTHLPTMIYMYSDLAGYSVPVTPS